RPGACLTEIGGAVHDVADASGFGTVRDYCGHGIARDFHIPPNVFHCRNDMKMELLPGMIFTIEPILTESRSARVLVWRDKWTVATRDGGRAAQFEHCVLVTEGAPEILTVDHCQ
ncbi:unnamed protein product, partial [Phaeothamnion confervicola]